MPYRTAASMITHLSIPFWGLLGTWAAGVTQEKYVLAERKREMIRQVVSESYVPIVAVNEHGTIIAFNRGAEQLFGVDAEDVKGQKMDLLVPERMRPDHWREFARAMREPTRQTIETHCQAHRWIGEIPEEFQVRVSIWTHPYHGAIAIFREESTLKDLILDERG